MFGFLTLQEKDGRHHSALQSGTKVICGVRFFEIVVEQSKNGVIRKRRLKKAARMMERAGVHTVLFPKGFSEQGLFQKYGIQEADEMYLRKMTAGEITQHVMTEHSLKARECCVAILGDHMSAEVRKALMELALRCRYTILSVPGGGGEICSVLRREYGVSVMRNAGEEQLKRADVMLTFGDAKPCRDANCLWLPFGSVFQEEGFQNAADEVVYVVPPEVEKQIHVDCCRNSLLSLLLEMGTIRANELEVSEIVQNA